MFPKGLGGICLENAGYALATPNAGGDHAVSLFALLHLVQQLYAEFGSGATQGVAQGYGSPVGIDGFWVQVQSPYHGKGLGRKGFVQLDLLQVLYPKAGLLEGKRYGCYGAYPHNSGFYPSGRVGQKPA